MKPDILCIGSVLWDVIGRTPSHMGVGNDVPGRIVRLPGGVALNIAMTLRQFGLRPALLSAVGQDDAGAELVSRCEAKGLICNHIYRSEDLPTDVYMAIEGANGLVAAIADAHSLEEAGARMLRPLSGTLKDWSGPVALDGNLTETLLNDIATSDLLAAADLRIAPASPGKAARLAPFLDGRGTLYVNLEEAGLLTRTNPRTATEAAAILLDRGAARVLVTDGGRGAADGTPDGIVEASPPAVMVTRVTGAGDTFMAAHIASETRGAAREDALAKALDAAALYVSGETPS